MLMLSLWDAILDAILDDTFRIVSEQFSKDGSFIIMIYTIGLNDKNIMMF